MYQSERDIILQNYQNARKTYAQYGVDTDLAIKEFRSIPIAIHNWSDDDVSGFEKNGNVPSENTVTGNYPGKARNGDEIRQDLEQAIRLSPCFHKLNLQSFYAEPSQPKERNTYDTEDYRTWIDWPHLMRKPENTGFRQVFSPGASQKISGRSSIFHVLTAYGFPTEQKI